MNKICIKNDESEENYCIEKEPSIPTNIIHDVTTTDLTITSSIEEINNLTSEIYSTHLKHHLILILMLKQLMNWPMNLLPLQ